jgi:Protein of unknown function (DUF5131)
LLLERARTASRCGIDHDRPDSASYRAREAAYDRFYYRKPRSVRSAGTGCVTACTQRRFCSVAEAALSPRRALRAETTRLVELAPLLPWPSNVWMGVSIENRRFVHRADRLRQVPAAVRFISAEPLLGPLESLDLTGIHWLIAGGESGPRHRPVRAPLGPDSSRAVQRSGRSVLLQTMGRPNPQGRPSRARWTDVERNAYAPKPGPSLKPTADWP